MYYLVIKTMSCTFIHLISRLTSNYIVALDFLQLGKSNEAQYKRRLKWHLEPTTANMYHTGITL